ncbi:hypothetical protein ABIE69_002661 [Rhodobacteraceae bacterium MBR-64]
MSVEVGGIEEAQVLLELYDKISSDPVRLAFALLHLNLSRLPGCVVEAEAHGNVSSLRVRDNGAWCYSVSTAQNWLLAYIRPPEYRKGRLTHAHLLQHLPDAQDRGDEHLSVKLYSAEDAEIFFGLIQQSRG